MQAGALLVSQPPAPTGRAVPVMGARLPCQVGAVFAVWKTMLASGGFKSSTAAARGATAVVFIRLVLPTPPSAVMPHQLKVVMVANCVAAVAEVGGNRAWVLMLAAAAAVAVAMPGIVAVAISRR